MTLAQWIWLGTAALLVFWMVGAYNRLVALRTAIGSAFQQVDDLLQRRAAAAEPLVAAAREPMAAEAGALDAWLAAAAQVRSAADALRARPVMASLAAALAAAEAGMSATGSRVLALLEQHPEVATQPAVASLLATLREVEPRLAFARQLFNDEAAVYNDAVALFPTRLLAPMFRFGLAGRL
jgi:LemA protein